jgi:magnesium transporter
MQKKRSVKAGLPPGTPIHIGEPSDEKTRVTVLTYNEKVCQEREITTAAECRLSKENGTVTWINVTGLHQVEVLEELNSCFGLHPLVLEDILNTDQRPKVEEYEGYLYIVLKSLFLQKERKLEIETRQISLILGEHFILSFQEKDDPLFRPIRERLFNNKGLIRKMGADYLVHAILDAVVDDYFVVLESLGEELESLEEELVAQPRPATLKAIHHMKREMIAMRKVLWPLREVIGRLTRGEFPVIRPSAIVYMRDVYDHTIQIIDNIESFRDILSGMTDIYLSSISNRMNEVMKVLTVIATLFIPLTFIAGVYGMNFKYMPELEQIWGYPAVLAVMAGVAVFMLIYFRRKRWI